jgi:hypothetical protein
MLFTVTSTVLTDFTPPHLLSKSSLNLVYNIKVVYGHLKSKNSQGYAQKPFPIFILGLPIGKAFKCFYFKMYL